MVPCAEGLQCLLRGLLLLVCVISYFGSLAWFSSADARSLRENRKDYVVH